MSVRINLEIGHEASLRTKKTPDGFTHDWEVFVRGCDGADLQQYVEKVVFHLHETFPKPKRAVKEPPYSVKESGYAGFNLPIEIYLKNKDEPKKIKFTYDLSLQSTGPTIRKAQKEKYVFHVPNEEFKYRLMKGGGLIVSSSNSQESESKSVSDSKMQLVNKPKLGGASSSDPMKKHRVKPVMEEPREHNFKFLFGTPIKTTAKAPEAKSTSSSSSKDFKTSTKDKEKSAKTKSPTKDKDREKSRTDKEGERKKEKSKDRSKDHDRAKEKKQRDKSPKMRSPSPKRSSPKRPVVEPPRLMMSSPKRPPSPAPVKEEKRKDESSKKYKKRDKEYPEKYNKDSATTTAASKSKDASLKLPPTLTREKEPSPIPTAFKLDKKEKMPKLEANKEAQESLEKLKNEEKPTGGGGKEKHKHKKKDKDRDKGEKREKSSSKDHKIKTEKKYEATATVTTNNSCSSSLFASPKPDLKSMANSMKVPPPVSDLDNDNSNSSNSSTMTTATTTTIKEEPIYSKPASPQRPPEPKDDPAQKHKRDKTKKKDKKADREEKKRNKRKGETNNKPAADEPEIKISRVDDDHIQAGSQSKDLDKENQENPEEYMKILRELQHKIMSLQDNTELQKVVQLIAETGRYEVSARTFDFDLCLLERSTVRRLQEFFSIS